MADARALTGGRPLGTNQYPNVSGVVSSTHATPNALSTPLYVDVNWSGAQLIFVSWPGLYGTTMPSQGNPVLIAYDENAIPYCIWWGTTLA